MQQTISDGLNFFMNHSPSKLIQMFGSPLYVYNESILRKNCREMKKLINCPHFKVNYSAKANSNLALLQIVRQEGLNVDAMSPGEIYIEELAGFEHKDILFISNNVSQEEMLFAIRRNILISVDSISQLIRLGSLMEGGRVVIRFNGGIGAGHHEKVITAGKNTKFGVNPEDIPLVKEILSRYRLKLAGINQHIGSLFMNGASYIKGANSLLAIAKQFDSLEFIDLGGGFGIPYHKQKAEARLDLVELGMKLSEMIEAFTKEYGKDLLFKIEPGRYIVAECGVLLGTVHAVKYNGSTKYLGTDLGFNNFIRTMLYDAQHELEVYTNTPSDLDFTEKVTVVGNICETGDIIAKDIELPAAHEGDIIGVLDAGAYGHVMSSNYNNRLRPAEVLIRENGEIVLIRERDELTDLSVKMKPLNI